MIFDILFYMILILPPIYAVIGTKNKYTMDKHIGIALILGVFAFLFGILYGLEQMIGAPQFLTTQANISLQGISTSLGAFGLAISGFVVALVEYLVAGFVSWTVETSLEKFRL